MLILLDLCWRPCCIYVRFVTAGGTTRAHASRRNGWMDVNGSENNNNQKKNDTQSSIDTSHEHMQHGFHITKAFTGPIVSVPTPCSPFTHGEQQPPRKCMPTRGMVDENYNTAAVHSKKNFINTANNSQWTGITFHGRSWYRDQSSRWFLVDFRRMRIFPRISGALFREFCWLIFQGFSRLPENPISWTHAMSILQRPHVRSEELANKSLFEVIELDAGWCTRIVSQLPVQIGSIRLQIRTWKAMQFLTTNQLPNQTPYSTCQTEANLSPANNRH